MQALAITGMAFVVLAILIIAFSVFYESVYLNLPREKKDPNESKINIDNVNE